MVKKQIIKLVLIVVLLAAVIVAYFKIKKDSEEVKENESKAPVYTVTEIKKQDITKFSYTYKEKLNSFENKGGKWICNEDKKLNLDVEQVMALLGTVSNITTDYKIDDVSDFSKYGLDKPANEIIVTTAGETIKIYIGDCNVNSGDYYLRINDETTVYMVDSTVATKFNIPASDLCLVVATPVPEKK